ncbi:type II toxin-antitoxin system VapC family toxin (plasmid) [Pedobacter sp. BS3]|uniref:PIN domain-containing protein n=1 Tax=Pedobacter sp. BS3 TaxID=2567937 RepID=UPI0011ED71E5|nr:PIN domain-containing protein [Pedobacter sp. BS3]TZF86160.1 type II toxin-antitoxin system VapC family toxin [Pedobacter sp. BS3]
MLSGAGNKAELNTINKKLSRFDILLINPAITILAIELIQKYKLSHGLALADGMIAATALEAKLTLFTYNTKDFKFIKSLELFRG